MPKITSRIQSNNSIKYFVDGLKFAREILKIRFLRYDFIDFNNIETLLKFLKIVMINDKINLLWLSFTMVQNYCSRFFLRNQLFQRKLNIHHEVGEMILE